MSSQRPPGHSLYDDRVLTPRKSSFNWSELTPEQKAVWQRSLYQDIKYGKFINEQVTKLLADPNVNSLARPAMSVRAKFKVESVSRRAHWDKSKPSIYSVHLQPVVSGSPENDSFFAATPGGGMSIDTVDAAVGVQFEPGQEFYVDFTPA